MARKDRKRLSMDIPENIHRELKLVAIDQNCTVTKYVLRAIVARLRLERGN